MKESLKKLGAWIKAHKAILIVCLVAVIVVTSVCLPVLLRKENEEGDINRPIALKNNECLVVGGERYINQEVTIEQVVTKTVIAKNVYNLIRTTSQPYSIENYVKIGEYYYYWQTSTTETEIEVGRKFITTKVQYSYLPYKENEELLLLQKTTTSATYDAGTVTGWREYSFQYELKLNGYFGAFEILKQASYRLAAMVNVSGKEQYYLEPSIPDEITMTTPETFTSYYYIEKL